MTIEEMRAKALPAQRSQKKARSLVSSLGGALKGSPGAPSQQLPPQQPAGVPRSPLLFQPPPAANMADAGMLSQLFGGGRRHDNRGNEGEGS